MYEVPLAWLLNFPALKEDVGTNSGRMEFNNGKSAPSFLSMHPPSVQDRKIGKAGTDGYVILRTWLSKDHIVNPIGQHKLLEVT